MGVLFWKRHTTHKSEQLDSIEAEAKKTHKKNISNIVKSRQKAVTLNKVLKQNNITLELAKAAGH